MRGDPLLTTFQAVVADGTPSLQVTVMVTCVLPCLKITVGDEPAAVSACVTRYGFVAVQDRICAVSLSGQAARTEPTTDESVRSSGTGVAGAAVTVGSAVGAVGGLVSTVSPGTVVMLAAGRPEPRTPGPVPPGVADTPGFRAVALGAGSSAASVVAG